MRALLIDDARIVRLIFRQILHKIGFEVVEAGDGLEGLQILRQLGGAEIVFVDCQMPVMDGVAFIRAVRADASLRDVQVIMVTATAEPAQVASAIDAGADDCIGKPFTKEDICAKLEQLGITASQT